MCALLMTWKIRYVSSRSVNYSSPTFTAENMKGTKWRLSTYANGIFLAREEDIYPHSIQVRGELLCKRDDDREVSHMFETEIDKKEIYGVCVLRKRLIFGTLTIQCYLSQSSDLSPSVEYVAHTGYDAEKYSIVRNVFLPAVYTSKEVQSGYIYLNVSYKCFSRFAIMLTSTLIGIRVNVELIDLKETVLVSYKIELMSSEERLFHAYVGERCVHATSSGFSYLVYIEKMNDTWTSNLKINAYFLVISLPDKCTSYIVSTNYPLQTCNNPFPEITRKNEIPSLNKIMKDIYVDKKFCDFTIRCHGREFQVHKVILAAASPVFGAMLDVDMAEKRNSAVDIEDIKTDTVSKMIDFLYTDTVDELEWDSSIDLYYAANKYQIRDLKQNCAQYMIRHLDVENVCEVLSISAIRQDEDLMKAAKKFVHSHFKQVLQSNQWNSFVKTNTEVACSMMYERCK